MGRIGPSMQPKDSPIYWRELGAQVSRHHGISTGTFYKYKAKFGGMELSDARKLRALEDENAKLKRLLAEAMLDNAGLKDLLGKNW